MASFRRDQCPLAESIANANEALALCLCNKFTEAEKFLEPLDDSCIYHMVSKATISYLQALLTYEQEYIEKAYEKVKSASQLCDKYRKKQTWSETFHTWVGRPYFDDFTEIELHAELCYAECLLERAMLTFIQDENLISFIKGGLKIRNAYNLYRNCMAALEQKPKALIRSANKVDFESGVYMGVGSFNLLLSLLPAKILRLLEWVGFTGDKKRGLELLDIGYHQDGIRSPMCTITLLAYQIVVSPLLGIGDTDIAYSEEILNLYLKKFPESSMFLYFCGRLKQTQGFLDEALELYEKSVSVNIDWHQIHHICYWEMMWCYSFQCKWKKAAEYAEKLSTESKWSKCSYLYMRASFLIMHQFELKHGDEQQKEEAIMMNKEIESILDDVTKYKQRIAGKSIPFEKFAVCRVEKYKATGQLVLPGLEIIHIWNGFTMFSNHTKTLNHIVNLTQIALDDLNSQHDQSKHQYDNICICKLLQGIGLRYLKKSSEAENILNEVAASTHSSHSSKMDCYLPPFASAELGFMYRSLNESSKALHQLQHTLKHYSKYGLESRLHFRIHSSIEILKEAKKNKQNEKQDSSEDEDFCDVEGSKDEFNALDCKQDSYNIAPNSETMHGNASTGNHSYTSNVETEVEVTDLNQIKNITERSFKNSLENNVDHKENGIDNHKNAPRQECTDTSNTITSVKSPYTYKDMNGNKSKTNKTNMKIPLSSPREWFQKKKRNSGNTSPNVTPVASPASEASSRISNKYAYIESPENLHTNRVTGL